MKQKELYILIKEEKQLYVFNGVFQRFTHQKQYRIWHYLCAFRKAQYWRERLTKRKSVLDGIPAKLLSLYYLRRKNILGEKTGIEIANQCRIGRRLNICHGGVVINADIGDDCVLHGNNILGNKGIGRANERPVIGNQVDIGAGAVVIGSIRIADHTVIGAGAVVTKSVEKKSTTVVGIPAREKN